jgi:hypothetical protein
MLANEIRMQKDEAEVFSLPSEGESRLFDEDAFVDWR